MNQKEKMHWSVSSSPPALCYYEWTHGFDIGDPPSRRDSDRCSALNTHRRFYTSAGRRLQGEEQRWRLEYRLQQPDSMNKSTHNASLSRPQYSDETWTISLYKVTHSELHQSNAFLSKGFSKGASQVQQLTGNVWIKVEDKSSTRLNHSQWGFLSAHEPIILWTGSLFHLMYFLFYGGTQDHFRVCLAVFAVLTWRQKELKESIVCIMANRVEYGCWFLVTSSCGLSIFFCCYPIN